MPITETPIYRQAFIHYLRRGTPIDVFIKAALQHQTPYYIWRTAGDNKVRPEHPVNEVGFFRGITHRQRDIPARQSIAGARRSHTRLLPNQGWNRPISGLLPSAHCFIGG